MPLPALPEPRGGARCPGDGSSEPASERVPGRLGRELQVAEVDAEPGPDAGADRHYDHVVRDRRRHAEAADEVGRAVDADEAPVEGVRRRHVVDEHHRARAFAAEIEPDRRTLPIDRPLPDVAGVEPALAVAQAADEGPGGLLAEDVAVRLAPALHRLLDGEGEPARDRAEEAMARIDKLDRREA